jgi:multidrug efflux pump subunit AcrB
MAHTSDAQILEQTGNSGRFFTEHRQVAWVLLLGTVLWGVYGYRSMPQRKDPDIPVRVAVAVCQWPGGTAVDVEGLVTRPIETKIAENTHIHPASASDYGIKSLTLPGLSIVYVQLDENVADAKRQFADINLKLDALSGRLPRGAGPINFQSDFGDTAALMLTVASPAADKVDVAVRAQTIRHAIEQIRQGVPAPRVSIVAAFPQSVSTDAVQPDVRLFADLVMQQGLLREIRFLNGPGFVGVDGVSSATDAEIQRFVQSFFAERLHESELHPDAWPAVIIRQPQDAQTRLAAVAGDRYSYKELDDFTDLIARTLLGAPEATKVDRVGVLPEAVYLNYSQERLASFGLQASHLGDVLGARNITQPGGVLEAGGKNFVIDPSGKFKSAQEIGDVIVSSSPSGSPAYLRDVVDITRAYQSPPRYLNFYSWRDADGRWHRSRAVTLAVQMRAGEHIAAFGRNVDERLASVMRFLPGDLIVSRTSDQPRQVEENIDLFMTALYEAIILVVFVSAIGFWDWRSALLMALSIPITLAMSLGMAAVLGLDLQQVSIATLIIALGLLVDNPVVAGDAIKRGLAAEYPPQIASWLGPTRLTKAIVFATITNIVAYLPFLMLSGSTGDFLYSLPVMMTCALVASLIVAKTFIPLLGYYVLRAPSKADVPISERRERGFTGLYARTVATLIAHRWRAFAASLLFLVLGGYEFTVLKQQFFPDDLQYWSYVDVWLPNDAPLSATNNVTLRIEQLVREVTERYGREHPAKNKQPRQILQSLTTFVGGGGPRFWFSVAPEIQQLNYAQVVIQVVDKADTSRLVGELQTTISASIPGARIDVRQLQTNPVEMPVEIRIAEQADVSAAQSRDFRTIRALASRVAEILRSVPTSARVRDDWNDETTGVSLEIDPDRASMAGVSNLDVALASSAAMSGMPVTTLREGNREIPVIAQLRMDERAQLSDIQNLYVYSSTGPQKIPLSQVSRIRNTIETQRIRRLEHFRTISVSSFPVPGALPSEVLNAALPRLRTVAANLPPGYTMQISGEQAKQESGFLDLVMVLGISVFLIYLALLIQFDHAVKPFLVFAAAPYGVVGALLALALMGTPFGFMAFLGVVSLIGVIVSHIIVLFDFIEEEHEKGAPLEQALIDAGIERLRPVMITVAATVLALFPLALDGGPLWEPLCYAQIGGLSVATFVTLLLVPVLYSIAVLDLKVVNWSAPSEARHEPSGEKHLVPGPVN